MIQGRRGLFYSVHGTFVAKMGLHNQLPYKQSSIFRSARYGLGNMDGYRGVTTESRRLPIIYLFTKEECTLCDEAKLVLQPYRHRFTLEEVDITLPENEPWYDMYKYDIPVFHMFEDFLFKHRVNTDILEKALTDYENKNKNAPS